MKIVVQNGVKHALARRVAERMAEHFPPAWSRCVKTLMLCGRYGDLGVSFAAKEHVLMLYWPMQPPFPDVTEAVDMLVAALATVSESGALPRHFVPAHVVAGSDDIAAVRERCLQVLKDDAAASNSPR